MKQALRALTQGNRPRILFLALGLALCMLVFYVYNCRQIVSTADRPILLADGQTLVLLSAPPEASNTTNLPTIGAESLLSLRYEEDNWPSSCVMYVRLAYLAQGAVVASPIATVSALTSEKNTAQFSLSTLQDLERETLNGDDMPAYTMVQFELATHGADGSSTQRFAMAKF